MFRFPENGALFLSKQRVSPFYHDLDLGLVGLVENFLLVEQLLLLVVEQLLNPIPSSNDVSKKSLVDNFRDTISWECFVKNDGVRSCLKELQSFLQSKVDVDQIHRVLMFLPCFVHVLCKTRCLQVDRVRILVIFVHRIDKQKNTVCLLLKFCPPGTNPELMMECKLIAHPRR